MHGATVTPMVQAKMIKAVPTTLTPEMARSFLENNPSNRPIYDAHVEHIARQIRDGRWKFNGDTIKIGDDGEVRDGQHRMWAVVQTGIAVETIIVYGIKKDAFATIDTLRKPRSGADVLALSGEQRYLNVTATALQWLVRWERGTLSDWRAPENRVENADIEEAFTRHPGMVEAVSAAMRLRAVYNPSILGFLFYVFSDRNSDLAERMMETLRNATRVGVSDPFFQLREKLMGERDKRRREPLAAIAWAIKAANAAHLGKAMRSLHWRSQGSGAEAFPKAEF